MTDYVTIMPLALWNAGRAIGRCEIVPGVVLQPLGSRLQTLITDGSRLAPIPPDYRASHAIVLDETRYFADAQARMRAEGYDVDGWLTRIASPYRDGPPHPPISTHALLRQVVVPLALVERIGFWSLGWQLNFVRTGSAGKLRLQGSGRGGPPESTTWTAVETGGSVGTGTNADVRRLGRLLHRYYRGNWWQQDRMATALSALWAAICSPYPDQACLSLATALEALCNTDSRRISHRLAQRTALLLNTGAEDREDLYRTVKRLYGVRSYLAHGQVQIHKGSLTPRTTFVTAFRSHVGTEDLVALAHICVDLIRAVLGREDLMTEIQMPRKSPATDEALRAYYGRLTLE